MKRIELLTFCLLTALSVSACEAKTDSSSVPQPSSAPQSADSEQNQSPALPEEQKNYIITGGSTQEEAELIETGVRYTGNLQDKTWISFRTGEKETAEYAVTLENLTASGKSLYAHLYDEEEIMISPDSINYTRNQGNSTSENSIAQASGDGRAGTGTISGLKPDTVYYVRIAGNSGTDYSLRITDLTAGSIAVCEHTAVPNPSDYYEGNNQDEAPEVSLNQKYHGALGKAWSWAAFTTGSQKDAEYAVTLENLTFGSKSMYAHLYDEYGTMIEPDSINYTRNQGNSTSENSIAQASDNGRAGTGTISGLKPESTYYVGMTGPENTEYILRITSSYEQNTTAADENEPEGFLHFDDITPGRSQSSALKVPLRTIVFGKYQEGYSWLAFTASEDTEYRVTAVNCTYGSRTMYGHLYDESGTVIVPDSINYERAQGNFVSPDSATQIGENGRAATGTFASLEQGETYYLMLEGESEADYSVLITAGEDDPGTAAATSVTLEEAVGEVDENDPLITGTNQNNPPLLKKNVWYTGSYEDGYYWISFVTGEESDASYSVTMKNLSSESKPVYAHLYDVYGTLIEPSEIDYVRAQGNFTSPGSASQANSDGIEASGTFDSLSPETVYYVCFVCENPVDYMIMIGAPEKEDTAAEEETVFEVPFELNETQVRFVANEAVLADETAAREALAPVAEVILAHPDHPILLAGTTATFGSQDACEKLSGERADTVKKMLIDEFGVPESQLVTAGLGYEKDPFVRGKDVDSSGTFVETEGAKNRRVIVLDAESDIASQILGN